MARSSAEETQDSRRPHHPAASVVASGRLELGPPRSTAPRRRRSADLGGSLARLARRPRVGAPDDTTTTSPPSGGSGCGRRGPKTQTKTTRDSAPPARRRFEKSPSDYFGARVGESKRPTAGAASFPLLRPAAGRQPSRPGGDATINDQSSHSGHKARGLSCFKCRFAQMVTMRIHLGILVTKVTEITSDGCFVTKMDRLHFTGTKSSFPRKGKM